MDPRRETFRWIHWPSKVATVFGTRVAETILASVHVRALKLGRTYGRKRSDQTLPKSLARRGPSTYESRPYFPRPHDPTCRGGEAAEDSERNRPHGASLDPHADLRHCRCYDRADSRLS